MLRRRGLVVIAMVGVLWCPVDASHASTLPRTDVAVAQNSSASKARADARALRQDVAAMLQKYLDTYGDRFNAKERAQLLAYRSDADRKLAAVVAATRRLQQATSSTAPPSRRRAAAVDAQSSWKQAKATADSTMGSAQQIMQPKLTLMEQLSALQDYTTLTRRFDALGAEIDAAAAAANRR